MKQPFWFGLVAALLAGGAPEAAAQVPAAVIADGVNVRSRPSVSRGEIVTQLARGQKVIVFEEGLPSASPKEPVTEWTRIELPAGSPVWVSAAHVALPAGTVKARRLNVRAGPSEDYAVLGTVAQGTALRSLEQRRDWLRIEAPLGLSGYVASAFVRLEDQPAPAETAPPMATTPAPATGVVADQPTPAAGLPPEAAPAPGAATAPPALASAPTASTPPADQPLPASPGPTLDPLPAPAVVPLTPPPGELAPVPAAVAGAPGDSEPDEVEISPEPRIVRREGIVRATLSVQAPTPFELHAADNGKLLNYLLPRSTNVLIRPFRGQRVRITGEEFLEPRWVNAPVIVVHDVKLAP